MSPVLDFFLTSPRPSSSPVENEKEQLQRKEIFLLELLVEQSSEGRATTTSFILSTFLVPIQSIDPDLLERFHSVGLPVMPLMFQLVQRNVGGLSVRSIVAMFHWATAVFSSVDWFGRILNASSMALIRMRLPSFIVFAVD